MKEHLVKYRPTDKLRSLISDNSLLLMVVSRFGISLGFGNKSVKEVCSLQNVDLTTFLAVANFISGKDYSDYNKLSLSSLMDYLKRAHTYFLDYNLPNIRRRLIEAIDCSGTDHVATLILKFYDEYVIEVRKHMEYENNEVFPYVENLLQSQNSIGKYRIHTFADKHNHIGDKLSELKEIIISYYPEKDNDSLNSVLFDIINCEQDLESHCLVEDLLFVPEVENLEREISDKLIQTDDEASVTSVLDDKKTDALSLREKEIITCVAKGMTNKEIADTLNLSVNTVTTHRRNISNKLEIHSSAGLTIYAIVNKFVNVDEVSCR